MKIFRVEIEWEDDPGEILSVLICNLDQEVNGQGGYYDDNIFFYGLEGYELNELMESGEFGADGWKVKGFGLEYESPKGA